MAYYLFWNMNHHGIEITVFHQSNHFESWWEQMDMYSIENIDNSSSFIVCNSLVLLLIEIISFLPLFFLSLKQFLISSYFFSCVSLLFCSDILWIVISVSCESFQSYSDEIVQFDWFLHSLHNLLFLHHFPSCFTSPFSFVSTLIIHHCWWKSKRVECSFSFCNLMRKRTYGEWNEDFSLHSRRYLNHNDSYHQCEKIWRFEGKKRKWKGFFLWCVSDGFCFFTVQKMMLASLFSAFFIRLIPTISLSVESFSFFWL